MSVPKAKAFGATLLLAGTMLGAGMLALPLVSAEMGFDFACLSLIAVWVLMTYTGLIMLEVCLAFPAGTEFDGMTRVLFGRRGVLIINGSLLLLLFSLSAAHIAGAGSSYQFALQQYLGVNWPVWLVSVLCTLLVALLVLTGTHLVDWVNRWLFCLNIMVFLSLVWFIAPDVRGQYLRQQPGEWRFIWAALPVFMTSFGFHGSIPTIVKYVGVEQPKTLRNIFIAGGVIPLLVYVLWLFASLGVLPRQGVYSYATAQAQGGSVGDFLQQITLFTRAEWVPNLFNLFSNIALLTSFLCIALSLFDVLGSTLQQDVAQCRGRLQTMLVCFVPPLVLGIAFPQGFVALLGLAAIFLAVLAIFFPLAALWKLRRDGAEQFQLQRPSYRVLVGWPLYVTTAGIGLALVTFQLLTLMHQLPQ